MSVLKNASNKQSLDNLKAAMDFAVNHLSKLMHCKNKAVSRAACSDLLRCGLKAYELYELEERVERLEEIAEGRTTPNKNGGIVSEEHGE